MPAAARTGKRMLIVGPAWVGDMVLSQSLCKTLQARTPEIEIDVLAPAWSRALLKRMPEVSNTIEMPAGHGELKLGMRRRLGRRLRGSYQQAIVLPRSLKAALLPWFAEIPVRTGFRGEMRYGFINDMRPLDREAMPRIVDRFVYLGQPRDAAPGDITAPAPSLRVEPANAAACIAKLKLDTAAPVLALMPGAAFGKSKQWPPDYFSDVADRYGREGWQAWIFGSSGDKPLADRIINAATVPVANLCGQTTLEDAIDLMSKASFAVSNDSGLMHIAAAVGVPLVSIYGSTAPTYTPPMIAQSKILWRGLPCSPCWSRTCRYGHYRCLTEISPNEVCETADRVRKNASSDSQIMNIAT